MAKRTLLQCILIGAGRLLNEELQARQKAREEASKKPPDPQETPEPEAQAAPEEEPTSAEPDEPTAAPPETGEAAPEGARTEGPAEDTTAAPPPTADASCETDLGASVMDPPRCDTWNFSGAADAGASIDGGDPPANDAQGVQAEAHRDDVGTPNRDTPRGRRRHWRGHVRRHRSAAPRVAQKEQAPSSVDDLRAVVEQLLRTVQVLRAEVAACRTPRPAAAESNEDTTPGVVAVDPFPTVDRAERDADESHLPGDVNSPPFNAETVQAEKPVSDHGVSKTGDTTSPQQELPPPPDWYVNTPLVRKEAWTEEGTDYHWDEGDPPDLVDDMVDDTMRDDDYDPRDDPDMERVA